MKRIVTGVVLAFAVTGFSATAEARGCIKGALVGGLAGHAAGHGFLGAAAGCAVGRHYANKKDRSQQQGQSSR